MGTFWGKTFTKLLTCLEFEQENFRVREKKFGRVVKIVFRWPKQNFFVGKIIKIKNPSQTLSGKLLDSSKKLPGIISGQKREHNQSELANHEEKTR